jgi:hypothetical protein
MLEHRTLLLRAPSPVGEKAASAVHSIVDGDNGEPLGYARWQPGPPCWWQRLLGAGTLAVHEQEDEPLLFTVHRVWGLWPRRDVRDADERPVGCLLGRLVHDRLGRLVAVLQEGVFRSPHQRVLADLTATPDGLRLTFHDDIAGEPFVKMLLLAAALQRS